MQVKKVWKIIIAVVVILIIGLGFAGNYFYHYAVVPSKKSFLAGDKEETEEQKTQKAWFQGEKRQEWRLTSADGLKLRGIYLPAKDSHKTMIIAHGYMAEAEDMYQYAHMFHQLGYNVLLPDARGHGNSEGNYIGFGWPERKDYLAWIDEVLKKNGATEEIALYGVSMGAATVMMTSGEKLPANVKAIIEDCGYSSAKEELLYQFKQQFDLPSFPLIQVTSLITKLRAGYFFGEASAVKQLHKNQRPMLFIHGTADDFVPYSMLAEVYQATQGPKEKWSVQGAGHALAYETEPIKYQEKVAAFLAKYIK